MYGNVGQLLYPPMDVHARFCQASPRPLDDRRLVPMAKH